jgi:putative ABC transport system permease protein
MSLVEAAGSWRVALRVARRSAQRNKARSLLLMGLLLIPVYAGSVLALTWHATFASPERQASWVMGQADIVLRGEGLEQAVAKLPAGSRRVTVLEGETIVQVGGSYAPYQYASVNATDPLLRGMYVRRAGRPPRSPGEVALTTRLADTLGVKVGGTVVAGLPPRELAVVGIIDLAQELRRGALLTPPGQLLSSGARRAVMVALPDSASGWEPPLINGLSSQARDATRPTPQQQATQAANLTLVVGFAGAQMALLVSAAFAVGARRQRRELAMIAAVGASNRQVARVVLANGLLLGAVAGTLGVGLGCGSFWSSRGLVERLVDHPLADTGVPVPHLVGIAAFAVGVGVLTALGPARGVSRQPVRAGLTGREVAAGASGRRLALAGLASAAGGAALAAYAASPQVANVRLATAGAGLVLLGVAACAPALVGAVGRLAATMPLPGRLALRHAARHRLRTGAAVAAVGAAIAGSVGMILFSAADSTPPAMPNGPVANRNMRTGQVLLASRDAAELTPHDLTAIAARLPLRALVPIRTVPVRPTFSPAAVRAAGPDTPPPDAPQAVAVGGREVIHATTGRDPDAATLGILRRGGAVTFYPQWDHGGTVRLVTDSGRTIQLPSALLTAPALHRDLPGLAISDSTARRLGLPVSPGGIVFDTTRVPTSAELAAAETTALTAQLRRGAEGWSSPVRLLVGTEPTQGGKTDPMVYVLAVISALTTMLASGVAVWLAAAEMRDDLSTLTAVGAGARLRRWTAAAQAGLIVGIGGILGVAGGIAPAAGLIALRDDLSWHVAWWPLVLTVLGAPLLAVAVTALATRPRLTLVRRPT